MIHIPAPSLCPCGVVHRPSVDRKLAHLLRPFDGLFLTSAAKNLMLSALGVASVTNADFGSLHSAYSTTGTNELTGGSPAYARQGLTWATASGGSMALAATLPTWPVPAASTVAWIGFWDAVTTGTFLGMVPAGGGLPQPVSVETSAGITADTFNAKAHGFTANKPVVFWGSLPTGISVGTIYYVIATGLTTDVFEISATVGGSALNITGTAPFNFFVEGCVPEAFVGQGTYAVSSLSLDLGAIA